MSAMQTGTDGTGTEYGFRTQRGEWRPPNPVEAAPIFVWPPRPKQLVNWLLAFPGFLWPFNSVYFLITVITWLYFQPDVSRTGEFRIGWIAQMYVRNLVLLWLTAGGWHLLLFRFKWQGTERKYNPKWTSANSKAFLWGNQLYDNIFWGCVSGVTVWTAYEVLLMWAYANELIPYIDWRTQPIYFVVWLCLIPFWREFHFYWTHRLIHWKPLYKYVHYLHHKPAQGHSGFDDILIDDERSLKIGPLFHYLHHRYFECNYGETTVPFDKWFGTFHNGTDLGCRRLRLILAKPESHLAHSNEPDWPQLHCLPLSHQP